MSKYPSQAKHGQVTAVLPSKPDQAPQKRQARSSISALSYETPHNREAEHYALGAMLSDSEAADRAAQLLRPEDFYSSINRLIFQTAARLANQGRKVLLIDVQEELRRNHRLDGPDGIGGTAYLFALVDQCPSSSNIDSYIHILRDLTGKREAAQLLEKFHAKALNGVPAMDVITELQHHVEELAARSAPIGQKRFHFAPFSEVLTRPDPEFLVHRLLVAGGTSLLTAKHASFKSFIALDIALCVTSGRAWHGYEVRQGPVIYVAAEGATGLKKRGAAWLHHYQETPENLVILDEPFQVADATARAAFIRDCSELKPALIILDTLARCAVGLDENNAGDMGAFADAVGALAKATGAHVLTVHHNNKGGEYRGSSAVPAAVDTHLSIERNGDSVTLKTEKQKDAEELPTLLFEKVEVSLPNSKGLAHSLVFELREVVSGSRFTLSSIEQKALDELIQAFGDEGATASQWGKVCEEAGIPNRTFRRAKERLCSDEIKAVVCPHKGERGAKFFPNKERGQTGPNGANDPNGPMPTIGANRGHPPLGVAPWPQGGPDGLEGEE